MKISAEDYPAFKAFFGLVWSRLFHTVSATMPSETHPLLVLERLEAGSPARARQGLAMAIGDVIEMTKDWPLADVMRIDDELAAASLPTMTMVRARVDKSVAAIMKRGRIRDEGEFHALRNAVDYLPDTDRRSGWALLGAFETGQGNAL